MAAPNVTVEIEFTAGVWTDVTSRVDMETGITINGGRPDVFSQPGPTVLTLTLTAAPASGVPDGAFVPNNPASTYWPNVRRNKRIRVKVTGSSTVQKFIGYIDGWPPVLDGAGEHIATALTATDRQKFLGRTALPGLATIEAARRGRVWRLDNVAGAVGTIGVNLSVGAGSEGALVTASDAPDGVTGAVSIISPTGSGPVLVAEVYDWDDASAAIWFKHPEMTGTKVLVDGAVTVYMVDGHFELGPIVGTTRYDDDAYHYLEIGFGPSNLTYLKVDGILVGTDTPAGSPSLGYTLIFGGMRNTATGKNTLVGNWSLADPATDTYDWNATTPTADPLRASRTGLAGDLTSDRLTRYAQALGFTDYDTFTGTVTVGAQDTSQGFLAALQELAAVEGSWAEIDHTTGDLRFGDRDEQITPDITVDADGDLVGDGFGLDDSDDGYVNAVTVSGSGGAYTATDTASIATLGRIEDSGQTIASDARWIRADAEHRLAVKGNTLPRLPKITIDLLAPTTSGLLDDCLAAGTGSRIKVTGLPSWMGRTVFELIAQGWQWTISQDVFTLALDTAPPEDGVNLNDAYRGRVAPEDGTLTLSASLTSGATSCTVASTTGNLLSTAGGNYPSWITIDGEDIKVTAVSGATSPQTLTIERAQEGTLAAAHASGAVVRLRLDPTLAY